MSKIKLINGLCADQNIFVSYLEYTMELWDGYDTNLKKIKDCTLVRGEAIPDGVFHLVCDIIVQHIDGTFLLMQRDARKHYGGMWEASAGGPAIKNPSGFWENSTRLPKYYDSTYEYFKKIGIEEI